MKILIDCDKKLWSNRLNYFENPIIHFEEVLNISNNKNCDYFIKANIIKTKMLS